MACWRWLFLVWLLAAFAFPAAAAPCTDGLVAGGQQSPLAAAQLKRGINLSRWWEDDQEYALSNDQIAALPALGFDFVRLPVSPHWLEMKDADEQAEKLQALKCDVASLLKAGLSVIVDVHASDDYIADLAHDGDAREARLAKLWQTLASVLAALPPQKVLLGLYNEPDIRKDSWWEMQGQLVKDVREMFASNTLIVSAGPKGGGWDLVTETPYPDKNLIYDFHFYLPMFLTHHGAEWLDGGGGGVGPHTADRAPLAYPVADGTPDDEGGIERRTYIREHWDRARIASEIGDVVSWSKKYNVAVACLEFGVYRPYVGADSRGNWLRDVRETLESAQIPWAMWEYRGNFGLFDSAGEIDPVVAKSLGLAHT